MAVTLGWGGAPHWELIPFWNALCVRSYLILLPPRDGDQLSQPSGSRNWARSGRPSALTPLSGDRKAVCRVCAARGTAGMSQLVTGHPGARRPRGRGSPETPDGGRLLSASSRHHTCHPELHELRACESVRRGAGGGWLLVSLWRGQAKPSSRGRGCGCFTIPPPALVETFLGGKG